MSEKKAVSNFIPPELYGKFQQIANEVTSALRKEGIIRDDEEISPRAIAYEILREQFQPLHCLHLQIREYSKSLKYCTGCYALFKHGATLPLKLIEKTEEIRINTRLRGLTDNIVKDVVVRRKI